MAAITTKTTKTESGAVVDQRGDDAGDRRDQDPLQVEAEDRPPGRVALVDHLLPGLRFTARSLAQHTRPSASPPRLGAMAIAKVEPLTTARALRGPFDYRLPEAMAGVEVGIGAGGAVRAPARARRRGRARRAQRAAAGAAGRAARGARGGRRRRSWSGSASGSPSEYCSTPVARARAGAAAGDRRRRAAARARPRVELRGRARAEARREAALERRRAARAPAAGGARGARGRARDCGAELAAAAGLDRATLRRLEPRGLVATRSGRALRPPRRQPRGGRRARAAVELQPPTSGAALEAIVAALDGEAGAAARAPAPRRHRLGQDRGLPAPRSRRRSTRGAGAIVLVPEIALTPQTVGRFRDRLGDRVAVLHSALARRRALRRVAAPALAARRASASARARPSSRRCATSA